MASTVANTRLESPEPRLILPGAPSSLSPEGGDTVTEHPQSPPTLSPPSYASGTLTLEEVKWRYFAFASKNSQAWAAQKSGAMYLGKETLPQLGYMTVEQAWERFLRGYYITFDTTYKGVSKVAAADFDCKKEPRDVVWLRVVEAVRRVKRIPNLSYDLSVSSTDAEGNPLGWHLDFFFIEGAKTTELRKAMKWLLGDLTAEVYPSSANYRPSFIKHPQKPGEGKYLVKGSMNPNVVPPHGRTDKNGKSWAEKYPLGMNPIILFYYENNRGYCAASPQAPPLRNKGELKPSDYLGKAGERHDTNGRLVRDAYNGGYSLSEILFLSSELHNLYDQKGLTNEPLEDHLAATQRWYRSCSTSSGSSGNAGYWVDHADTLRGKGLTLEQALRAVIIQAHRLRWDTFTFTKKAIKATFPEVSEDTLKSQRKALLKRLGLMPETAGGAGYRADIFSTAKAAALLGLDLDNAPETRSKAQGEVKAGVVDIGEGISIDNVQRVIVIDVRRQLIALFVPQHEAEELAPRALGTEYPEHR